MSSQPQIVPAELNLDVSRPLNRPFANNYEERRGEIIRYFQASPAMVNEVSKLAQGKIYTAVITPEMAKKLSDGTARFGKRASQLSANIHDESGKIISQVTLEEASHGIFALGVQLALHFTLAEILDALEHIDRKVTDILQGQRNDRLAKVDAGIDQYMQAMGTRDNTLRTQQLGHVISMLNEGRAALLRQLDTDSSRLNVPGRFWSIFWNCVPFGGRKLQYLEDTIKAIQEEWIGILRSSYVLAMAYAICNEQNALRVSLKPLQESIRKYSELGESFSRQLPYDPANSPEVVWKRSVGLAEAITSKESLLDNTAPDNIQIEFKPEEVLGGNGHERKVY
jgi:hypothetical protein